METALLEKNGQLQEAVHQVTQEAVGDLAEFVQDKIAGDKFQSIGEIGRVFVADSEVMQAVVVQFTRMLRLPAVILSPIEQIDP